jgi:hypothetical protein
MNDCASVGFVENAPTIEYTFEGDHASAIDEKLELLAAVLAAAVGMMQQCIGLATPPDRHHQRVESSRTPCGELVVVPAALTHSVP